MAHERSSLWIECIGASSPSCGERPNLLFRVRGEARWAEARGPKGRERGVLGDLPTSYRVWGSGVSSPIGVRGKAPAAKRFSCILEAPDSLAKNLLGAKLGGWAWPPCPPPFNLPMIESRVIGEGQTVNAKMCVCTSIYAAVS